MQVELCRVEIPGYADALRKEAEARQLAFAEIPGDIVSLAGLPVRLLTLRLLHRLKLARNGFVVPCRFESGVELYAHALAFCWQLSPEYRMLRHGADVGYYFRRACWEQQARKVKPQVLVDSVRAYLDETFFDSPFSSNGLPDAEQPPGKVRILGATSFRQPAACEMATIIDMFFEAGYRMTADEIINMPLVRLWQHARLIMRRVYQIEAMSHSARVMQQYMAGRN